MKNIMFDMGGVLINWEPENLREVFFSDPDERSRVKKYFMEHPDWAELDRRVLDDKSIIEKAAPRCGVKPQALNKMLDGIPPLLTPKEDTLDIVRVLKQQGFKLYILSNMPHRSCRYLEENSSFLKMFHGKVFSCNVGKIKPDADIYEHILEEFALVPEETVFIDDMEKNITAAEQAGIHGIHFRNAADLKQKLKNLGCL